MTAVSPLIVEGLSFRYRSRELPAIQDISLAIEPAQIVLLAGASGCGKTTLIRCINGLIPRSYKGDVTGRVLLQDPERQILGSVVMNEVAFGLENLGWVCRIRSHTAWI